MFDEMFACLEFEIEACLKCSRSSAVLRVTGFSWMKRVESILLTCKKVFAIWECKFQGEKALREMCLG